MRTEKRKLIKFTALCCLCSISLLACGFSEEEENSSVIIGGSKLSSGGGQSSSSKNSSSSAGFDAQIGIEWQDAPENSYVHGATKISLDAFMISKHLITQGQYKAIMGENPAKREKNDALPVEGVSWFKAVEFCKKLSLQSGLSPNAIRLPTEAEWEFTAFADVIKATAGYFEWTNDCFDSTFPYKETNPSGPPNCLDSDYKVRKGSAAQIENRFPTDPYEDNDTGFRVVVRNEDYF